MNIYFFLFSTSGIFFSNDFSDLTRFSALLGVFLPAFERLCWSVGLLLFFFIDRQELNLVPSSLFPSLGIDIHHGRRRST